MSNLPKGWKEVLIENVFDNVGGTSLEKFVNENGKYKFISIGNYSKFGRYIDNNQRIDINEKSANKILNKNDLVMVLNDKTSTGDIIGSSILIEENNKYIYNQRSERLICKDNIYPKFAWQLLNSKYFRKKIVSLSQGGTQIYINFPIIKKINFFLPPLEEQKKIAYILSTVDKKIAFVEENINATEELKKGLMQKLLTEGIGHTEFKDSELGKIPESWEVKSIGSLTSLTTGGTPSTQIKNYWNPKEVPWLSSGEVNKKNIYFTDNMISKQGLNNSAAKFIPKYSVLIALAGQGKTRGTVAISEIELTTNQSVASILPSEKLDMYFIYYNLDSRYEEIRSMSTGVGGRGGLNLAILKSIKIALPPQKEQKQIAEIFSTVDKKLENLKEKKQSFEELKKGLMQKLLTGKVRV